MNACRMMVQFIRGGILLLSATIYADSSAHLQNQISTVSGQIVELRTEYGAKREERRSLVDFLTNADRIKTTDSILREMCQAVEQSLEQGIKAHLIWVQEFRALVQKFAPDLKGIRDGESYRLTRSRILEFRENYPKQTAVDLAEVRLTTRRQHALEQIIAYQAALRNLDSSRGLKVVGGDQVEVFKQSLQNIEAALEKYSAELESLAVVVASNRKQRIVLMDAVPEYWLQALERRLHAANIETGVNLIAAIDAAINGPEVYVRIRAALKTRDDETSDTLNMYLMPIHARRQALESLEYAHSILHQLPHFHVSPSMGEQIEFLVAEKKRGLESTLDSASINAKLPDRFFNERKRLVQKAMARFGSRTSIHCSDLARGLLTATSSSWSHEADYKEFRTQCP